MTIQKYVVGFLFNKTMSNVALIEKIKPKWQKGFLNGIGGKIENNESALEAMIREFYEETGHKFENWQYYCRMKGKNYDGSDFEVECFYGIGDPFACKTMEKEQIGYCLVESILSYKEKTIGNVPWLISLAIDFNKGVYPPKEVTVIY